MRLNETWALDFMADALYDGRPFRALTVIDEGNREALAIEIGPSIPNACVIRAGRACAALWPPGTGPRRQRPRARRRGLRRVVHSTADQPRLHTARQARSERLHRTLQPDVPRRGCSTPISSSRSSRCARSLRHGWRPITPSGPTTARPGAAADVFAEV